MSDSFGAAPVGSAVQPCPASDEPRKTFWIEIELLGEDNRPIPWERYAAALPDGNKVEGYLDDKGLARIDQITAAGECMVSFPDLDKDAWDRINAGS